MIRCLAYLLLIISLVCSTFEVQAHNLGKQQLERVPAGPFLISAWTDPIEANTRDELHVTVAVEDDEGLVLNAEVTIRLIQNERILEDVATHERATNKLQYEGRFRLNTGGLWRVEITVKDGERVGTASFELSVEQINDSILPFSVGWIIAGGLGVILIGLTIWNRVALMRKKRDVL